MHEQVKDVRQGFRCDAPAIVGYPHDRHFAADLRRYRDGAPVLRIFRRVIEQVGEHLGQPYGIAIDIGRQRRNLDVDLLLAGSKQRAARFDRLFDDCAEGDGLSLQRDLAGGQARHFEQIIEEPGHVIDLAIDDLDGPMQDRFCHLDPAQNRDGIADRYQRIAQLMGQHRDELFLPPMGLRRCLGQRLRADGREYELLVRIAHSGNAASDVVRLDRFRLNPQQRRLFPERGQLLAQA